MAVDSTTILNVEQASEVTSVDSTPDSITGVEPTSQAKAIVTIDYIRINFPDNPDVRRALRSTFDVSEKRPTTVYGYQFIATILGTGAMMWSKDKPELGILVNLPAGAIAQWARPIDWLFDMVRAHNGRLTRVDIALDDTAGRLDLNTMLDHLDRGNVVTRWRIRQPWFEQSEIGKGPARMTGITLGSRQSESYMRIYDKRIEQDSKQNFDGPKKWIRCEVELSGKKSHAVLDKIIETIRIGKFSQFAASLVYGLLDFKLQSESDVNKSRWDTCPWWSEFLGDCGKARLSIPVAERKIADVMHWFKSSIAPMAAVILLQTEEETIDGYKWLMEVIADGEKRFKLKHRKLAGLKEFKPE